MNYEFLTNVGRFRIRQDPENPQKYLLEIDGIHIARYESPEAAAGAVYNQQTGWERWDMLRDISGPRDLSEWLRV